MANRLGITRAVLEIDHWANFAHFASLEQQAGGPDPQLKFIKAYADEQIPTDHVERAWLAACYSSVHCIPTGLALWDQFRPGALPSREEMTKWLCQHWSGLPMRPERRCVYIPSNLADCLESFGHYAERYSPFVYETYESAWVDVNQNVRFMGRYMTIKFLELLRVLDNLTLTLTDLRPEGAWSPRRALSLLWPEEAAPLDSKDASEPTLELVNKLCGITRERLRDEYKVTLSWFDLQVLLCEYRETLVGGFYPGCGHDEEMEYIDRTTLVFGEDLGKEIYRIRKQLFNNRFLGELRGWHGIRRECWRSFKNFRYIWNDIDYDYTGPDSVQEVAQELAL